jgi:hypothetical protein
MAEAVGRLFVHVTRYRRGQMGMGRDPWGDGGATCKIAGIAYTGSNPVPATPALTSNNAVAGRLIKWGSRVGFPHRPDRPTAKATEPAKVQRPGSYRRRVRSLGCSGP